MDNRSLDDTAELPKLLPLLADRSSPSSFDSTHVVSDDYVDLLLEAAGKSPSAGNSQPWAFIVGRREDPVHERLTRYLTRSSSRWAPYASLLVANLTHIRVEESELEYSEFAYYDLGQAVAHMTVQALALGLATHQFRAFDREGVEEEFAIPPHWEATSMSAIGYPGYEVKTTAVQGSSSSTRERLPSSSITWARHL